MINQGLKKFGLFRMTLQAVISTEEWVFDKWHNVHTTMGKRPASRDLHNFYYEPTRPGRMRTILRSLDIEPSHYTFVDFGSGKGRPILIAAELPFRAVEGIEFNRELHDEAVRNIRNIRRLSIKASCLESRCLNATEYVYPNTPLVLYFYNPFGEAVMRSIMSSLVKSLEQNPRDVVIAMLLPEFGYVVESFPQFKLDRVIHGCHLYRNR